MMARIAALEAENARLRDGLGPIVEVSESDAWPALVYLMERYSNRRVEISLELPDMLRDAYRVEESFDSSTRCLVYELKPLA